MEPYQPPASDPNPIPTEGQLPQSEGGRQSRVPCQQCGSSDVGATQVFRSRPNPVALLFGGWLFLWGRFAFVRKSEVCRDCGAERRYRTAASWIALVSFCLFVGLAIVGLVVGEK
jgi:hypothetical protein